MINYKSDDQVEILNAHGPYDHGLWNEIAVEPSAINNDESVSGGLFHERSRHLVKNISQVILSRYSAEEASELSIIDVGCYDGWVLVQLAESFKFKSAVGVEPRLKNIQKGKFAREHYKISTSVKFLQGDIDSLEKVTGTEKFDIVLCLGVLHHVESTTTAIRILSNSCRQLLVIDSMVIDRPKKDESQILRLLNLRDIAYINTPKNWAIAAFKYETPYFDGSTSSVPIVGIPEERLIKMSLDACGFSVTQSHHPEETAFKKEFQKLRGVRETFIVATKMSSSLDSDNHVTIKKKSALHETTFIFSEIPPQVLFAWLEDLGIPTNIPSRVGYQRKKIKNKLVYNASKNPTTWKSIRILEFARLAPDTQSVLVNMSRSPLDKSLFEFGKFLLKELNFSEAKLHFKKITSRNGCDWRAFYRSCYFLMVIAEIQNDTESLEHYKKLLELANPLFPISIEDGVKWVMNND